MPVSTTRIPASLCGAEDKCGLIALWFVLRELGTRTTSRRLIRLCDWRPGVGAHAIGLALAFRDYAIPVAFHSDPDPAPQPNELPLLERAARLGIAVEQPESVVTLLERVGAGYRPIVLYERGDVGHFSVIVRRDGGSAVLNDGWLPVESLERRRAMSMCYRQTVIPLVAAAV